MAKLRIEFSSLGGGRGRLGGQIDAREEEPLGSVTLEVGTAATSPAGRPVVPSGAGTVFAELLAADAAIYVDLGPSPDPTVEPRLLLRPGGTQRVRVTPGHRLAAILAGDIPDAVQATQDRPFAPVPARTVSVQVGPSATGAAVALPACAAASYRIRNAADSASPAAWTVGTSAAAAAAMPVAYGTAGTGGVPGDPAIDPGGVEVIGLSGPEQAALAAGTLYLSAICPAGGSATLDVTPGMGG